VTDSIKASFIAFFVRRLLRLRSLGIQPVMVVGLWPPETTR